MRKANPLLVVLPVLLVLAVVFVWFLRSKEADDPAQAPEVSPLASTSDLADATVGGEEETTSARTTVDADAVVEEEAAHRSGHEILVIDDLGTRLVGVRIQTFEDSVAGVWHTEDDGVCRIPLPPEVETFRLLVEMEGFAHQHRSRDAVDIWPIQLSPATAIFGHVIEEGTKTPLPHATVTYRHDECRHCPPEVVATDMTGAYELSGVPRGETLHLEAAERDHVRIREFFEVREDAERVRHDFVLPKGALFRGQVVGFRSGSTVAKALIESQPLRIHTNAQGEFEGRIDLEREGDRAFFRIEAAGHCSLEFDVPTEHLRRGDFLSVRLPESAHVEGQVRDQDGNPVTGARVFIGRDSERLEEPPAPAAWREPEQVFGVPGYFGLHDEYECPDGITGSDGAFRSPGFVPGGANRLLKVLADGFERAEVPIPATTVPGDVLAIDVTLTPVSEDAAVRLCGSVLVDGRPARASVIWMGPTCWGSIEVNEAGSYESTEVEVGEVELSIHIEDRFDWHPSLCPGAEAVVEIRPDTPTVHDFLLQPRRADISGHVRYMDGRPARAFEVQIECPGVEFELHGVPRPDGYYEANLLDCGRPFLVSVNCMGEVQTREVPSSGATGVDFVLPNMGRVLLRAVDKRTGDNIESFVVGWRPSGETAFRECEMASWGALDQEGWVETLLPAGKVDLIFHAGPYGCRPTVHRDLLVTMEDTRLKVSLEPGCELHVQVPLNHESLPPDHVVFVLDPDTWEAARSVTEHGVMVELLSATHPGRSWGFRRLWFGDGRASSLRGLEPGEYRLKAIPDDLVLTPVDVTVTDQPGDPIELRWEWK